MSMMSSNRDGGGPNLRLGAAVALLALCAVLPSSLLGWAAAIANPVEALIAPWQQTLGGLARWARTRAEPGPVAADPGALARLTRERDEAQSALLQATSQVEELRRRIAEVSRGMELNNIPVVPVAAPVIGFGADLASSTITVRAGRDHRVEVNNVAVVGGVHIVGLVTRVAARTCTVLPITDRAAAILDARIMLEDTTPGPLCQLKPDGHGRLTGPVEDDPRFRDAAGRSIPVLPGMRVRLYDRKWPPSAQGLVVGQVVRVAPLPSSPLRPVVTVEPVEPIDRVSELTIRTMSGESDAVEGGGALPPGGPPR